MDQFVLFVLVLAYLQLQLLYLLVAFLYFGVGNVAFCHFLVVLGDHVLILLLQLLKLGTGSVFLGFVVFGL